MEIKKYFVTILHDFVPPFPRTEVTLEAFNAEHARNIARKCYGPAIAVSVKEV